MLIVLPFARIFARVQAVRASSSPRPLGRLAVEPGKTGGHRTRSSRKILRPFDRPFDALAGSEILLLHRCGSFRGAGMDSRNLRTRFGPRMTELGGRSPLVASAAKSQPPRFAITRARRASMTAGADASASPALIAYRMPSIANGAKLPDPTFARSRDTTLKAGRNLSPVVLGPEHERSEMRRFRGPRPQTLNRHPGAGSGSAAAFSRPTPAQPRPRRAPRAWRRRSAGKCDSDWAARSRPRPVRCP